MIFLRMNQFADEGLVFFRCHRIESGSTCLNTKDIVYVENPAFPLDEGYANFRNPRLAYRTGMSCMMVR